MSFDDPVLDIVCACSFPSYSSSTSSSRTSSSQTSSSTGSSGSSTSSSRTSSSTSSSSSSSSSSRTSSSQTSSSTGSSGSSTSSTSFSSSFSFSFSSSYARSSLSSSSYSYSSTPYYYPPLPTTPIPPTVPTIAYYPSIDLPLVRQTPTLPLSTTPLSPRAAVLSTLFCGDGVISGSEECDDGNTRGLDGCSEDCRLESGICGDAVVQAAFGEQCDEGAANGTPGSLCTTSCKVMRAPTCGDGVVDPGEECDLGQRNADAAFSQCLLNCILPYCGDGILAIGEECDDGNQFSLDGCDSSCRRETQLAAPGYVPGGDIRGSLLGGEQVDISRIPTPAKTPTGPGLVIFLASGAAAGIGLARRRLWKK